MISASRLVNEQCRKLEFMGLGFVAKMMEMLESGRGSVMPVAEAKRGEKCLSGIDATRICLNH